MAKSKDLSPKRRQASRAKDNVISSPVTDALTTRGAAQVLIRSHKSGFALKPVQMFWSEGELLYHLLVSLAAAGCISASALLKKLGLPFPFTLLHGCGGPASKRDYEHLRYPVDVFPKPSGSASPAVSVEAFDKYRSQMSVIFPEAWKGDQLSLPTGLVSAVLGHFSSRYALDLTQSMDLDEAINKWDPYSASRDFSADLSFLPGKLILMEGRYLPGEPGRRGTVEVLLMDDATEDRYLILNVSGLSHGPIIFPLRVLHDEDVPLGDYGLFVVSNATADSADLGDLLVSNRTRIVELRKNLRPTELFHQVFKFTFDDLGYYPIICVGDKALNPRYYDPSVRIVLRSSSKLPAIERYGGFGLEWASACSMIE